MAKCLETHLIDWCSAKRYPLADRLWYPEGYLIQEVALGEKVLHAEFEDTDEIRRLRELSDNIREMTLKLVPTYERTSYFPTGVIKYRLRSDIQAKINEPEIDNLPNFKEELEFWSGLPFRDWRNFKKISEEARKNRADVRIVIENTNGIITCANVYPAQVLVKDDPHEYRNGFYFALSTLRGDCFPIPDLQQRRLLDPYYPEEHDQRACWTDPRMTSRYQNDINIALVKSNVVQGIFVIFDYIIRASCGRARRS